MDTENGILKAKSFGIIISVVMFKTIKFLSTAEPLGFRAKLWPLHVSPAINSRYSVIFASISMETSRAASLALQAMELFVKVPLINV